MSYWWFDVCNLHNSCYCANFSDSTCKNVFLRFTSCKNGGDWSRVDILWGSVAAYHSVWECRPGTRSRYHFHPDWELHTDLYLGQSFHLQLISSFATVSSRFLEINQSDFVNLFITASSQTWTLRWGEGHTRASTVIFFIFILIILLFYFFVFLNRLK